MVILNQEQLMLDSASASENNEDYEGSWSENTTPQSSVDIEEIVRRNTPLPSAQILRPPVQRHRHRSASKSDSEHSEVPRSFHGFKFAGFNGAQDLQSNHDGFPSSAFTFLTTSPGCCEAPWNGPGIVEEMGEEMGEEMSWDHTENETMVVPKVESPEGHDMGALALATLSPGPSSQPSQLRRPRGRPRKHPIQTVEAMAKVAKGRSKTGCITCRRRKKKCDEAKPECVNCQKNAVKCEGYPEKTVWRSGRERAEEARLRRTSIQPILPPEIIWKPVIHGVETQGDRIFFEHYIYCLSNVLTAEGETESNAFKDMLLPKATEHLGLMHSILSLSSKHIDYRKPYGQALLKKYPDINEESLLKRSNYHHVAAFAEFGTDIEKESQGLITSAAITPMRLGQMLCFVLTSIAEGDARGEHRMHLNAYKRLLVDSPPEDSLFIDFIKEFFLYHIFADELIFLPDSIQYPDLYSNNDSFSVPSSPLQPGVVRLLGVKDGCFEYMSQVTQIRNKIRTRMQYGLTPSVDAESLYRGTEIDAGIRTWTSTWPESDPRHLVGLIYKQMLFVYLWRTLYPPNPNTFRLDPRISENVNYGLELLELVEKDDRTQAILLAPAFILGCAAFEPEQRRKVETAIDAIESYSGMRNTLRAKELLQEVWRLMDEQNELSWDWQSVAKKMGKDFLAT